MFRLCFGKGVPLPLLQGTGEGGGDAEEIGDLAGKRVDKIQKLGGQLLLLGGKLVPFRFQRLKLPAAFLGGGPFLLVGGAPGQDVLGALGLIMGEKGGELLFPALPEKKQGQDGRKGRPP